MPILRQVTRADEEWLLALNAMYRRETSALDSAALQRMLAMAWYARACCDRDGFLLAFDQHARYHSPNFLWFRARYPRFVYVDRVITAPHAQGRGCARALYRDVAERARDAGFERVVCEVNLRPPNPGSSAFHDRLGFNEIGQHSAGPGRKSVRYLALDLT